MKHLTWRRVSLLGLVLMAASAVTAAMHSEKSDKSATKLANGSLTNVGTEVGVVTCTVSVPNADPCNASTAAGSNTSAVEANNDSDATVSGNNGNTTTLG